VGWQHIPSPLPHAPTLPPPLPSYSGSGDLHTRRIFAPDRLFTHTFIVHTTPSQLRLNICPTTHYTLLHTYILPTQHWVLPYLVHIAIYSTHYTQTQLHTLPYTLYLYLHWTFATTYLHLPHRHAPFVHGPHPIYPFFWVRFYAIVLTLPHGGYGLPADVRCDVLAPRLPHAPVAPPPPPHTPPLPPLLHIGAHGFTVGYLPPSPTHITGSSVVVRALLAFHSPVHLHPHLPPYSDTPYPPHTPYLAGQLTARLRPTLALFVNVVWSSQFFGTYLTFMVVCPHTHTPCMQFGQQTHTHLLHATHTRNTFPTPPTFPHLVLCMGPLFQDLLPSP